MFDWILEMKPLTHLQLYGLSGNNPEEVSVRKSDAALPRDFFFEILFWSENAKKGL